MESLLHKLPKPPDKYNLKSVIKYYSSFAITVDLCLVATTEKQVLRIMQNIKISKAAGVDKLSERLLKDGGDILAKQVSALCNLSITRGVFPSACKVAKLNPVLKKRKKADSSNYRPISLLPVISTIIEKVVLRSLKRWFVTKQMFFFQMKIYYTNTNLALEQIIQQIFVCPF